MRICCVTGNRPHKFPWLYGKGAKHKKYLAEMKNCIQELISDGYDYFISGGALGVDQDFAESVLEERRVKKDIKLEIAVPCKTQAESWREEEQLRYRSILERADSVVILSEHYTRFCMQKRNEYMVEKSDLILAFWNGEESGGTWNTISYAKKKKKDMIIVNL